MVSTTTLPAPRTVRIGADIGGTKTEVVAIDGNNTVLHTLCKPTGFGKDQVLGTLFGLVQELLDAEALTGYRASSLGVGIPGAVDQKTGAVANAVNVGLSKLELGPLSEAALGLPVCVENDVNAAAVGAHHLLADSRYLRSSAYLNLGTGLAAGFVNNGRLLRGSSGAAGEIGHLPLVEGSGECPCGQTGCLELVASGSGLARQWSGTGPWPAVSLFEAATSGDHQAQAVQRRFFQGAATAVRILGLTFDPSMIYVGGGLTALGQPLLSGIRQELAHSNTVSPFTTGLSLGHRLRLIPTGLPIGSVGAAICGGNNRHQGGEDL